MMRTEFSRVAPDTLHGTCPEMLRDFLEVRGLGILNVRAMFGASAIKQNRNLRLIIVLQDMRRSHRRWTACMAADASATY